MAPPLINAHPEPDGSVVIELRGELDVSSSDQLYERLVEAIQLQPSRVVVDMRHLTFIDSTGIGTLVAARNAIRKAKIGFVVRNPSPFIADRLRQIGLYRHLGTEK